MRRRRATVATPGASQCKTGGVRRLAVANGPNIFQMLLVVIATRNRALQSSQDEVEAVGRTSDAARQVVVDVASRLHVDDGEYSLSERR